MLRADGEGTVARQPLTLADREEISRGLAMGLSQKDIAASIGRCESVISREIERHGGRRRYRAHQADEEARRSRERPKERKLDTDPALHERVFSDMRKGRSPQQVAGRLRFEHRLGETDMSISHEAIYTYLYALPKGELARAGVFLRSGRSERRPRGRKKTPAARIVGMVSIEDRPEEVEGRRIPGHWEGDLIIGKGGRTALGTLVERTSRFLIPVPLPSGKEAHAVKDSIIASIKDVPGHMRKSLTWDQGTEMARHAELTLATDMPVYFAHPHSPWERGTNENTNRLLREYFPKGEEITSESSYLWAVANELNDRPRAILGFRTPREVFTELLLEGLPNDGLSSFASTG
jgi:IS30 family transposase